ncbi:MAG: hypothetical protein HFG71_06435 [Hungatella sp.]|mgnify:CR=1 FL=1|jgi:hypothetical protein|nr:hypothetical protein [Hungatella sp.]
MKVTARNWQTDALPPPQTGQTPKADPQTGTDKDPREAMDMDILETSAPSLTKAGTDAKYQSAEDAKKAGSDSSFKMKSSGPKNSVGELAAMLARSETVLDVQQVFSKAMRALADLKMGALASEGKDAKKYAQQIKRMEKLIKRIQKKLKHLSKEQRMEDQAEKAAKKAELEKEKQIRQELEARRKKRRRDEKEYALKEMAQDGKDSVNETVSSMFSAMAPSTDNASLTGMDIAMPSGDLGGMDLGGLDILA